MYVASLRHSSVLEMHKLILESQLVCLCVCARSFECFLSSYSAISQQPAEIFKCSVGKLSFSMLSECYKPNACYGACIWKLTIANVFCTARCMWNVNLF